MTESAPGDPPTVMGRRRFLRRGLVAAILAGGVAAGARLASYFGVFPDSLLPGTDAPELSVAAQHAGAPIPTRPLGRTGLTVSAIGVGGYHMGLGDARQGIRLVQTAIDLGVTFMDNAYDYCGGESERRMGRALAAGGRREKVVLMTKCCDHARTRAGSLRGLEESLRRLRTETIDLWQLHEIERSHDPARVFARGGAIEALDEAKRSGKVRFVGFTGHRDPALMKEMLSHGYPWDAVQIPVGPADPHHKSFEREILPMCVAQGIGVIGMKSLVGGKLAREPGVDAGACRRYALALPIATLVCGIDSLEVLAQDVAAARNPVPMSESERESLRQRVAVPASRREYQYYKAY